MLESVESPVVQEDQPEKEDQSVESPTLPEVSLGHSAEMPALESQGSQNSAETN